MADTSRRSAPEARPSGAFQLLLACCAWPQDDARRGAIRVMAHAGIDWDDFLALVRRHRVAGLAQAALDGATVAPPAEQAQMLGRWTLRLRAQARVLEKETGRLGELLADAGIEAVFLKGAALARSAYGAQVARHSKDIDLLVDPPQVQRVVALLEAQGYALWLPAPALDERQWPLVIGYHKELALSHPVTRIQVEPHWRLLWNDKALDGLDPLRSTEATPLADGRIVQTLDRESQFAYLCAHGAEHCWFRLKWLADIHALIAGLDASALLGLRAAAAARGAGMSATLALHLCGELFGLGLPEEIAADARSDWRLRRMTAICRACLRDTEEAPRWGPFMTMQILLAHSQGYLARQIWFSWLGMQDIIHHPLPRRLHFFYPVMRVPLGLLRRLRRAALWRAPLGR